MAGGITFGASKGDLAKVTDNGVCDTDPRVMTRTNEATKALLDEIIPVGGMATYGIEGILAPSAPGDVGTQIFLPKELENAIEVEVVSPGTVNGTGDINQGWHDIINNFAYVDPNFAHDNPMVDMFLQPDPDDPTILRRLYDFPGLSPGALVYVTGAKRYLPITADGDYLIVQNVRALKLMILSIEREENGKLDEAKTFKDMAVGVLQAEVKKHLLDPRNSLKRKAAYQSDLVNHPANSFGRVRAKLALDLPGFLLKGKSDISYLLNRALEALVRRENLLRIASKWDIHGTTTEIVFTLPIVAADTLLTAACPGSLAAGDYDIIKRMCQFYVHSEQPIVEQTNSAYAASAATNTVQASAAMETEVYALLEARLAEALEYRRRVTYEAVLAAADPATMAYYVALLALDLPNGLKMSNVELLRLANTAEQRLMERGKWKWTIGEYTAIVRTGEVLFPREVEAIYAASINGGPVRVRGRYFEFHENTTGTFSCEEESCAQLLIDQGEVFNPELNTTRRKYKVLTGHTEGATLRVLVKRRWINKALDDTVVVRNYEAIRLMSLSAMATDPKVADGYLSQAIDILQKELQEYLAGIMPHIQVQVKGMRRIRMLR
ncbi:MAG: hypothetical protein QOJ65_1869 [Fimbriimonadaceae bacterium]|jgi:hypothetical protein|nr:hypothetical protein [Fimbriimonadaceae bacterium]